MTALINKTFEVAVLVDEQQMTEFPFAHSSFLFSEKKRGILMRKSTKRMSVISEQFARRLLNMSAFEK